MRLYGREAEAQRLNSLLDSARAGKSGVLMLRGEPGIGKTALLQYAIGQWQGMVLSARGLEAEAQLAFSGLADLCRPILGQLNAIPEPQAAGIAGALGLAPPIPIDRFVVCVATLSLLAAAAEQGPVLAVVDDSHWLDDASSEAIFFAARRLEAERIALVVTSREGEAGASPPTGVEELLLSGLDPTSASALLDERSHSPIAAHVMERLFRETGGNPLALCEVAASLSEAQLAGAEILDDPLPAAASVETALLRRVERLPPKTRQGLLVVAASYGDTSSITVASRLLGLPSAALGPAEELGLVRRDDGRMSFSHPLLRSAVYHHANESERTRVHAALAEAFRLQLADGTAGVPAIASTLEQRAWQLAAAASYPDESAASVVEEAARTAQNRGAHGAAASAYERAARLTADHEQRAQWLLEAARNAQLSGRPAPARELLTSALASTADGIQRGAIQHLRAHIEMAHGEFIFASKLLEDEAVRTTAVDNVQAALMLADAAVAASTAGEIELAVRLARKAQAVGKRAGGTAELAGDMILGGLLVASGEAKQGKLLVLRHARLPEGQDPPPFVLQIMPTVLAVLEEYDKARAFLDWLTGSARALSAPSLLVPALSLRSDLAYRTGDWYTAYADATEGLRLARDTNGNVTHGLVYLVQIEAARGLAQECREHAAELLGLASRFNIGAARTYAHAFIGRLALGLGQIDEAIAELEAATRLIERHQMREPNWVQEAPDLIEAYVRAGKIAQAAEVLSDLQAKAERTERLWTLAAAARCRGLLADTGSFEREFEEALRYHDRTPTPFEHARTELCFGERLRRARRPTEARLHLRSALEIFDRLDAAPWTARARAELRASGEKLRMSREATMRSLTPQELQLALTVGRGATNKEASATLFISPKTVEAHLRRIYVKLGIRSRTELALVLAREQMLD
jgi:DNA-binding CsgD family transcriptional regulator